MGSFTRVGSVELEGRNVLVRFATIEGREVLAECIQCSGIEERVPIVLWRPFPVSVLPEVLEEHGPVIKVGTQYYEGIHADVDYDYQPGDPLSA